MSFWDFPLHLLMNGFLNSFYEVKVSNFSWLVLYVLLKISLLILTAWVFCCLQAFSSCSARLPISVASLVTELGLRELWLMGIVALRHEGSSGAGSKLRLLYSQDFNHLTTREVLSFLLGSFVVLGLLLLFSSSSTVLFSHCQFF